MSGARPYILWFGEPPGDQAKVEYRNRNCVIVRGDLARPTENASKACAAIVNLDPEHENDLLGLTTSYAGRLVDHGLRVDIVAPDDAAAGRAQTILGTVAALPGVNLHTAPQPAILAEAIARWDAGDPPRLNLAIDVPGQREPLRLADHILFQRAFAHCSAITLVELGGGRSDARVFAVYMTISLSDIGAWPQPAFAKVDRRDKIAVEYGNYGTFAERYIPFGLRPNVQSMVVGSERSLLVGNFVDRSESLWDLALRHVAGPAITALLEETLAGWRDQAYAQDPKEGSVAAAMAEAKLIDPDRIEGYYVERAAESGVDRKPADLWAALLALKQRYRVAPIHGDLHGENVRVRGQSAILIDLASVCTAPATADLAALETWLAFEPPPGFDELRYHDQEWASVVDRLYDPGAFRHPPGPCRPATRYAWIETVVRQIRTHGIAIQSCLGEYQTAIAVQLLRRCQWLNDEAADRGRRARGYRIATRLIADLEGSAE